MTSNVHAVGSEQQRAKPGTGTTPAWVSSCESGARAWQISENSGLTEEEPTNWHSQPAAAAQTLSLSALVWDWQRALSTASPLYPTTKDTAAIVHRSKRPKGLNVRGAGGSS